MAQDNVLEIKHSPIGQGPVVNILPEAPKEIISSEKFLRQNLPVDQMPPFFSFQNDEVKFGLVALSKWAKAAGGKETAGVIYTDATENMRFRHTNIGIETGVSIYNHDLSKLTPVRAQERLVEISNSNKAAFVLLPEGCPNDTKLNERIITETGKKIDGSVHVHPSGNPPNGHDLAILLFARKDSIKGVVAGDKHYLMVASKDTPNHDIQPTKDNKSTTMHDFGAKIDEETIQLIIKSDIPTPIAVMQSLIKHCRLNKVGLYEGDLETNIYRKIT